MPAWVSKLILEVNKYSGSNKETSRTIEECNSLERHVQCVCHAHYITRPVGIVVLG